jgi:twitching motility protein PilT
MATTVKSDGAAAEPVPAAEAADALRARLLQQRTDLKVNKLFRALVRLKGSDLHLKVGNPPIVRVNGTLKPLDHPVIDVEEMVDLLFPMMNERTRKIFERDGGCDFAHIVDVDGDSWRFRVNMLQQLGRIGLVARRVNNFIPTSKGFICLRSIEQQCHHDQGMVLLAGVTGSGKSTTIASMLNYINRHYRKHILTLEDPIEFVFKEDKCLINQREIGQDVFDFAIAMKHAVREDPDIILVGELRDEETFLPRSMRLKPVTWCSERFTLRALRAPSAVSSTCSPKRCTARSVGHRDEHEGDHRSETAAFDQAGRWPRADL